MHTVRRTSGSYITLFYIYVAKVLRITGYIWLSNFILLQSQKCACLNLGERERERESIHNLEITIAAAKLYYVFTSSTHSKRTTAKKFG